MTINPILTMTASELSSEIARGEISPLEVLDLVLARLDATEPNLNAFVHVDREGARAAAERALSAIKAGEPLGPLHGVPVSIKDLIDVRAMPARYGSLTLKDKVAVADAPSVERLRAAGAIIIGKTTTSEFGYRGYTKSLVHGNTRNPWNLMTTPGGSSGGAVASVAAGVTPIALGTDGGGSVRAPCALTGLVGIKANFGRVPIWPASATPTLAHVGPIARTVEDAARLLNVIAGSDRRDPFSLYPSLQDEPAREDLAGLRIAYSPTLGYAKVDEPVANVVQDSVAALQSVFPHIETVESVCADPADILAAEFIGGCSARLGDLVEKNPDLIDPPLLAAIKDFRERITSDGFTRLLRKRIHHRETLREFFERYDVLITPTTPCMAWDIDQGVAPGFEDATVWSYFTYPFNLSSQPAGSIPCGFSVDGLPIGLQFVVPLLREDLLVACMRLAEKILEPAPTPIEPRQAE